MAGVPKSYGYPVEKDVNGNVVNGITAAVNAVWLNRAAAARFSVVGEDDWKVTVQGNLDRGIRINSGTGIGDAVMDVFTDYETRSLPAPTGASQYFLIAARRNWSTPASTTFVVIPGNATRALPLSGVSNAPGQQSDQPIALVRVMAGNTVVQEIVDLRAWAGNGGVEAADVMGRDILARPGAAVKVGSSLHRYEYNPANGGSFAWQTYSMQTAPLQVKTVRADGAVNAANAERDTFFPAFPNGVTAAFYTDQTFYAGAPIKEYRTVELTNGRIRWRLYRADSNASANGDTFIVDITLIGY